MSGVAFSEGLGYTDPMPIQAVKAVIPWCACMMVLYSLGMLIFADEELETSTVWFWVFVGVISALIVKATHKRIW